MKRLILPSLLFLVLFTSFATLAHATGFVPLAPISGLTTVQPTDAGLSTFFNNLYKYLIGLSAALAVIMIVWGGLEISTQDSVSKQGEGKEKIRGALFGLALVLSPVLVFTIINPKILNLSVGLEKLNVNAPTSIFGSFGSSPSSSLIPSTATSGPSFPQSEFQTSCSSYSNSTNEVIIASLPKTCSDFNGTSIAMLCCFPNGGVNTTNFSCCVHPK